MYIKVIWKIFISISILNVIRILLCIKIVFKCLCLEIDILKLGIYR